MESVCMFICPSYESIQVVIWREIIYVLFLQYTTLGFCVSGETEWVFFSCGLDSLLKIFCMEIQLFSYTWILLLKIFSLEPWL